MTHDTPVRDSDGIPVWRIRVNTANELTCTVCGETSTDGYCVRCGREDDEGHYTITTRMVKTLDYLLPGEYEVR